MDFKTAPHNWTRALLVLAPLAIAGARRSSTLLLAATAAATLFKTRKSALQQWRASGFDPVLLAGLAVLILWGCVSLLWSPLPARGLKQLAFDFATPLVCGLWLLSVPGSLATQKTICWFALSVAFAATLVALQLHFQFRIEAVFNAAEHHREAWRFNMVVVTYALLIPASLLILKRAPFAAGLSIVAIVGASILSQSATSKTALIAGVFAYALVLLLPRKLSLSLFGLALLGLLVLQPVQGQFIERSLQATIQTERLFQSAKERIVIWKATGAVAIDALPWGTGIGSSDAVSERPFAKTLPPDLWIGLRQTHAHNAFLNVLMELGLPGLIGMALIAFGLLRTLARLPHSLYAPSMALAAQVITVDLVSHGAWQAWWLTAIMLGILALKQYAPANDQSA
ncbi:O-antigen ligase family protein [Rhizobiales bacterium TNE-4]|nr:O-antigen ligase family protein [Rhizobiales bacterium TNE-4]MBV1827572.1 O-antigen ligase family protein [Rhizobiales bacterium TNE-4]